MKNRFTAYYIFTYMFKHERTGIVVITDEIIGARVDDSRVTFTTDLSTRKLTRKLSRSDN